MFKKILVGSDGSDSASRAVERAVELAEAAGAELLVVHVHRPSSAGQYPAEGPYPELERGKVILREAEDRYGARVKLTTGLRQGDASSGLLDVAEEEGVDLVVVGNKGMAGAKRFLGSVPNRVSHHAPCDVWIVHTT